MAWALRPAGGYSGGERTSGGARARATERPLASRIRASRAAPLNRACSRHPSLRSGQAPHSCGVRLSRRSVGRHDPTYSCGRVAVVASSCLRTGCTVPLHASVLGGDWLPRKRRLLRSGVGAPVASRSIVLWLRALALAGLLLVSCQTASRAQAGLPSQLAVEGCMPSNPSLQPTCYGLRLSHAAQLKCLTAHQMEIPRCQKLFTQTLSNRPLEPRNST